MASRMIRHGTIGFSVAGDLTKLERANKLMDRFPKQAERVKRSMSNMIPQRAFNEAANGFDRIYKSSDRARESIDNAKNGQKLYGYQARRTAKEVVKSWDGVTRSQDRSRVATNKMGTALSRTHAQVGASATRMGEKSDRALAKTRNSATRTRGSFDRLYTSGSRLTNMASMVTMALLPVGAAFKHAADQATELQNKYTTIRNLLNTGGESASASKAETRAMQKENNGFALQYGVDPSDMASGGEELIRRGYSGKQELASHKSFLQAARASGDDYKSVVNYGASALEKFGYKTKAGDSIRKMRKYTDKVLNQMSYAADLTATDFTGIGNALNMAGGTSHSTGQSLASTVSALGVLSNNGLDGTLSGTGLRKVLNSFASPYTSLKSRQGQAIKAYDIDTSKFYGKDHNLKSLPSLLDYLNKKTSGLSESQKLKFQNKFFGATGQEAGNFLMANTGQIRNLTKQVNRAQGQKGGGYIANLSRKNMKSWQNQINRTKQYLNVMGQGFAKDVLPGFTKALKFGNGILDALIKWPDPVKKMAGYATAIATSLAAAAASIKLMGKFGGLLFGKGKGASVGRAGSVAQSTAELATDAMGILPTRSNRLNTRSGRLARTKLFGRSGRLMTSLKENSKYQFIGRNSGLVKDAEKVSLSGARHLGPASKLTKLASLGRALPWLDIALAGTSFIGINKKNAGGKIGNFGGTLAGMEGGAALGSFFGPLGTLIGGGLGAAGGGLAGSKAGKAVQNAAKKTAPNIRKANRKGTAVSATNPYGTGAGTDIDGMLVPKTTRGITGHKNESKKRSNPYSGLSSQTASFLRSTHSQLRKASSDYLTILGTGSKKAIVQNRKTYSSILNAAKSYTNSRKKSADKNINYLKSVGAINGSEQKKQLSAESSGARKRIATIRSTISSIERDEKRGGGQRTALVAKLNGQLLRLTDAGSRKQKKIYKSLHEGETKLSVKQYSTVMKKSRAAKRQTIANADKQYHSQVSSAQKTYNKTLKSARATYGVHSKMYRKIKGYAQDQYDKTTDEARRQYKKTVKYASNTADGVIAAAARAAGGVNGVMGVMASSIDLLNSQMAKAVGGTYQKPKSNKKALRDYYNLNGLPKALPAASSKGTKGSSGKGSTKRPAPKSKKNGFGLASPFASGSVDRYPHGLPRSMWATVNDGGAKELIIPPAGRAFIAKRMNQKVWLRKGTHVLNGRDTKRATGGVHLATGTVNLSPAPGINGKKVKTGIEGTKKKYDKELKGSGRAVSSFKKSSRSNFKKIKSDTTNRVSDTTASVYKSYKHLKSKLSDTTDDISKDWRKSWKSLVNYFGDVFGKLKPYAHKGMAGAISSLNGGFSGINSALAQFGGNKSVLKPIHYARGSKGPIASDRMAVLNDASSGPRQELVVRHDRLLKPQGRDVLTPLQRGDEVLNGSQVEQIKPYLPHFAKGTGVSKSKLRKLANKNAKNPTNAYNNEFTTNVKLGGNALQKGIGATGKNGAKMVGPKWSNAMWSVITDAMSGGSAAGGNWRHDPGMTKTNGFGASRSFGSHDGVDFSGPRGTPIRAVHGGKVTRAGKPKWDFKDLGYVVTVKSDDGWQEIYQEFGDASHIKAHVGQIIKTGDTVATQGGIIGSSTGPHVHIGVSHGSLWDHGGSSTRGWYDVTKMHGHSNGSPKRKKADTALEKLAKRQLGKPALRWIKKNLQDSISDADVGHLSGSMANRAKTLAAALKKMYPSATNAGIAAVLGNWEFESGLNPTSVNSSGGASGLGQWLDGRKTGLINYARRHGKSWKNAGVQLQYALKGDGSDSSVLKSVLRGHGSVASLASKFSSQWERGGYNAQHVEGARKIEAALHNNGGWSKKGKLNIFGEKDSEVAINPKKPNADGLIGSAIKERSKVDSKGLAGQMNRIMTAKTIKADNQSLVKQAVAAMRKLISTSNTATRPAAQPKIVINSTVNFNGSVDKDTADYATDRIGKIIERKVQEALNKQAMRTQRSLHLTD